MNTFYYYYFLFYRWFKVETQPELRAWAMISFAEALIIIGLFEYFYAYLFGHRINLIIYALIIPVHAINYYYYIYKGNAKKIIKMKPRFFRSHVLSIILSLFFFYFLLLL